MSNLIQIKNGQRNGTPLTMDYAMEDTQNSAPGEPSMHEAAKLSGTPHRNDAQSVTKRYTSPLSPPQSKLRKREHKLTASSPHPASNPN